MTSFLSTETAPFPALDFGVTHPRPIRLRHTPVIREFNPDAASDDDDDDDSRPSKKTKRAGMDDDDGGEKGPKKRHITFSKRKAGIMKKAYELATLTGTQVLLLVVSETGIVYTFTTSKFQPLVGAAENGNPSEGQRLIQQCLAVTPEDGSDYISPPPDGPLLPLPPSAHKRPFEANSSIHGGQIALRTRAHRPSGRSKGRPSAILTGAPETLPNSSASHPQRLHPLQRSPGIHGDYTSPALPSGDRPEGTMQSSQDYAYMMQRNMSPGRLPNMSPEGHTVYPPHHPHNYAAEYGMVTPGHATAPFATATSAPYVTRAWSPPPQHYQRSPGPSPHLQHAGNPTEPPMGMYEQPSVLMQPHSQHPHHSPQHRWSGTRVVPPGRRV
ncbi:BQ5605_C042g11996 [Microbotryum silenes-dioicae]|uniref:BQ5605_C042g11996 protein n=1 Tax=Microbotryum silenes-dioicae TaxID=796604 RepID=A0A2X0MQC1_9BASI|nr:BQ5605_C042g11996 [Microbotryum silenes-dioicae]